MRGQFAWLLVAFGVAWSGVATAAESFTPEQLSFFEEKVRPVLIDHCIKCHGESKTEGELRLDSREALMRGGERGPAVVPGKAAQSLLILAIKGAHDDLEMPPRGSLPPAAVEALTKWVNDGAAWSPDATPVQSKDFAARLKAASSHWSLQKVSQPAVPKVKNQAWVRTSVDAFILKELEAAGIEPMPEADKRTLIRRVTYDLTGLPPTPEEIKAFLADTSPKAFERVVDRLLASKEYGRRWGRHWLDIARYADTAGDGTDMPIPEARYYRDYVIDAFNRDMPFDQFLQEQIAGDILARKQPDDRYKDKVVATGFIALSRRYGQSKFGDMHLVMDETIDTIGRGVLGLTLSCARCHDHKYDPISQEDYYALKGFFSSTQYPHAGTEHGKVRSNFVPMSPEGEAYAKWETELNEARSMVEKLKREKSKKLPSGESLETWQAKIEELKKAKPAEQPLAWAVTDQEAEKIGPASVLVRGDPGRGGAKVPRGYPQVLGSPVPEIPRGSSGRLQLAQWISSPANPLTARVMVNRIWQHHFGTGLVGTPGDFGVRGDPPTHPALLDHLASEFVHTGWSVKAMHRLMVLSSTYRLSSQDAATQKERDPLNKLRWRQQRTRLEAEAIRDALLMVSGQLDLSDGEAHPFPDLSKHGFTQHNPFKAVYDTNRRSVYLMTQRQFRHPFLDLFDGPDTNKTTELRRTATVPMQALFMVNSPMANEAAKQTARRLLELQASDGDRIHRLHEAALGRSATADEIRSAELYLREYQKQLAGLSAASPAEDRLQAWTSYARVILASNEFIYVD